MDQIAEGMTNASSALAAAGNDFKQSVALLTAANTTVQNASKASTALRTISARLRKTKSELDELGEAMTESQHDAMIKALANYKVSLVDVNGEYKSTYEIMQEIAAEWHNMTSMEQAAIAELVAGTRQQVVFYSIVEHFDEATNAMKAMSDSAGTLSESYNIYLGTTAAQLERFDIAWKTFSMDFVDSSTLKGIINIGTGLLNIADKLQRVNWLIPTIILGINTIKALKFGKSILESKKTIDMMVKSMIETGTVTEGLKQDFIKLTAAERQEIIQQITLDKTMSASQREALMLSLQQQGLATSTQLSGESAVAASVGVGTLAAAEGAAAGATNTLTVALKKLFASNPVGWVILIVSAIVSIGMGIAELHRKKKEAETDIEDLKESLESLANTAQQTASSMKDMNDRAGQIIPRFVELSKGIDSFGNKTSKLTDEEYAEFVDLSNQLADLFPQLKVGMDENGNAMLNLSGSADQLADSLYRVLEAQNTIARAELANNLDDAISTARSVKDLYEPEAIKSFNKLRDEFSRNGSVISGKVMEDLYAISNVSPEIQSIFDKLGGRLNATGGLELTILGNESEYINEEQFFKEFDALFEKTKDRLKADLDVMEAQDTIAWSYVKQSAMAWLQNQPAFKDTTEVARDLIQRIIGDIDLSKIDVADGAELNTYLYMNILKPINDMSASTQAAVNSFVSATSSFSNGRSSVKDMKSALTGVSKALKSAGTDAEMMKTVLDALGATELSEKIDVVTRSIQGEDEAVEEFVNSLSGSELENAYEMLTMSKTGELPLETVISQLNRMKTAADDAGKSLSEVLDLTGFMESLEKTASNISSVVSMMKKLKEGTALTAEEVIKLAAQYPELLEHSNLFVDKSVEGQQRLLNAVIESNRLQYESTIKTQVAELKAAMQRIERQSAAELYSTLGWARALAILNDPNVDMNAKENMIQGAQEAMRNQIAEKIKSIENFGSDLIDAALSGLDDIGVSNSGTIDVGGSSSGSSSNNPIAQWMSWAKHIRSIGAEKANNLGDAQYLIQLAQTIFDNIWNGVVSEDEARSYIEELVKGIKDLESKVKKSIDDLVSYRLKMLQEAKKQEKKDLEDRLSALKDFYSKQKDMLKDQRDEEKYLDEQAEKRKSVSDIQAQIDQLSYDDSAWAEKRRAELYSDLAGAQKELSEFESDHALDVATEFLDKQYEEQEASIQREIDAIEDILNDPNTLYNQALVEIQSSSEAIYKEMKEYGANNLNNGVNEAEKLLDAAAEAIATYNEYRDATVGRPTAYNGRFVPGSHGSNEIEWVIEDGYIIPVIRKGGYASGTPNASAGLHRIDENGTETIFTTAAGNTYRVFSHGDKVLDANSSSFLYEFAKSKGQNLKLLSGVGGGGGLSALSSGGGQVVVNTGNIIINGNADERTVSEIRRAQRENVEMILRELNRLNR